MPSTHAKDKPDGVVPADSLTVIVQDAPVEPGAALWGVDGRGSRLVKIGSLAMVETGSDSCPPTPRRC